MADELTDILGDKSKTVAASSSAVSSGKIGLAIVLVFFGFVLWKRFKR